MTVPTDAPEEDGTLAWDETTIVVVPAHAGGVAGLGYSYADVSTAKLIESKLAGVVEGMDASAPRRPWAAMVKTIRNLGRPGSHRWRSRLWMDGLPELRDGALWPNLDRAGMGLQLKRRDAEAYAV